MAANFGSNQARPRAPGTTRPVTTLRSVTKRSFTGGSQAFRDVNGSTPLRRCGGLDLNATRSNGLTATPPNELSSHLSRRLPTLSVTKDSLLLESRRGVRRRSKANCKRVAAEAAAIMAVMCALLIYLIQRPTITWAFRGSKLCATPGCRYQAEIIAGWVNVSVDPCDDFEAYACSRWTPNIQGHGTGSAMMSHANYYWIHYFRQRLEEASSRLRIAKQIAALFDSCKDKRTAEETRKGIYEIKEFMRDLKIRWPEPPLPGVEPLGVILDLVFNWGTDIWFRADLSLHTTDIGGRRNLLLQPAVVLSARWSNVAGILFTDKFIEYWLGFYQAFAPGEEMRPLDAILDTRSMQTTIYADFVQVENSQLKHPRHTRLGDIQRYTPHISARRWIDALNDNLVGHGQFISSDGVTTADTELLMVVDRLFANFSREQLLDHISWEFVQLIAPLADSKLLLAKYGTETRAEMQEDNFCSTQIERAYRWLVTAALLLPQFDPKARAFLDQQLANITEAAIMKVSSVLWADNGSVELIANQLRNQTTVIWPPYEPLSDNALYKASPSWFYENASFTQHWIRSVTRWRQLRTSPTYRRSDDSPRSYAMPHFEYDPFSNAVRVSAATLFIPWYQAAGSKAALYGGIGFTFAREVVKSFDGVTPAFDRRGEFLDTWPTNIWKEASANKASCLRPEFDTVFPEIPALEIAYAAFLASSAKEDADRSLPIAKEWSPERVFFVTACFTMCNMPNTLRRFRVDCNKAARNFAPFAAAFNCPAHSRMNPREKCPYFY
ncbi:endothelin-converting enzyme 1-like isoform X2 [Dermacentor albipictus]